MKSPFQEKYDTRALSFDRHTEVSLATLLSKVFLFFNFIKFNNKFYFIRRYA
jgi:hypothetical protein